MSEQERENAADPQAVREKGRKEKRAEDEQQQELRELLEIPAFRKFVGRLIFTECHLLETSFHPNGQQFAANEARRGVGSQLQAEIMNASLEGWISLLRERQVKR